MPTNSNNNNNILIKAQGIGVKRGDNWLIHDVDITVRRGEIVTIIGPNGAGKSTTAKALLGIIPLNAGTITRSKHLRVGYVPQRLNIDAAMPLTVRRFINLPNRFDEAVIHAALERVGAAGLVDKTMVNLSGGEFQRVLIARAIISKPDLLVLDEPVQGVDYTGEAVLYQLVADVRDELNCGVLLISHDLHIVMAQTDQVICLNGHICCNGTPGEVIADPQYKAIFGANQTHAIYEHHHDHVHAEDGHIIDE